MERESIVLLVKTARRFICKALVLVAISGIVSFYYSHHILQLLMKVVGIKIYYLTLPEVFLSSVGLSLYAGLFFAVPLLVCLMWYEFRSFSGLSFVQGCVFALACVALFYGGGVFCYSIVLPSGITFLTEFGKGNNIMAMISMERFVAFCAAMVFAFGLTFEVPIILLFLGKMGLVRSKTLAKKRRYAALLVTVGAALITPTPDIYNMALLAVPAYALYEIGILLMRMTEKKTGTIGEDSASDGA